MAIFHCYRCRRRGGGRRYRCFCWKEVQRASRVHFCETSNGNSPLKSSLKSSDSTLLVANFVRDAPIDRIILCRKAECVHIFWSFFLCCWCYCCLWLVFALFFPLHPLRFRFLYFGRFFFCVSVAKVFPCFAPPSLDWTMAFVGGGVLLFGCCKFVDGQRKYREILPERIL